jgi:hypothetical protein
MLRARSAGRASAVDTDQRPVRGRRREGRGRRDASGDRGSARGASLLARVVHLVVSIIVVIIVAGIVLVVLKANPTNSIVSTIHDWAQSLVGPFDGMFSFHNADIAVAVNWGIAAIVYLIVGGLIARLLGGLARR